MTTIEQRTALNRSYIAKTMRALARLLEEEFGLAGDHVIQLLDEDASTERLRKLFEIELPSRIQNDRAALLVFFSGHTHRNRESGEEYLVAADSDIEEVSSLVSIPWIIRQVNELPCRHKLAVLDAAYSGELFQDQRRPDFNELESATVEAGRGIGGVRDDVTSQGISYYLQNASFSGIAAGTNVPMATGKGKQRQSVFVQTLLQEMRDRADSSHPDHLFTFRALAPRVVSRVASVSTASGNPSWGHLGAGDGDFVFRPTIRRLTPSEALRRREVRRQIQEYTQTLQKAQAAWNHGNSTLAQQHLLALAPAAGEPDMRGIEWYYLQNKLTHPHQIEITDCRFSPDGRLLATADRHHIVNLWDVGSRHLVHSLRGHTEQSEEEIPELQSWQRMIWPPRFDRFKPRLTRRIN